MKKALWLAFIFTVTVLTVSLLFLLPASAETHSGTVGINGANLLWTLDTETGELAISGSGALEIAESAPYVAPWADYRDSIKSVTIDNNITRIGSYAFEGCSSLKSIEFPSSLQSIGPYAFSGCTKLRTVTVPDSVTYIAQDAFRGCLGLVSVTLPFVGCSADAAETRTHFGVIFGASNEYQNKTYVPTPLRTVVITGGPGVGARAFVNCEYIQSIVLPDSTQYVWEEAFVGCTSLQSVSIGTGLTRMGNKAFSNCISLQSISIPSTVFTYFGYKVFDNCPSLEYNEHDGAYYLGNNENPYVILMKLKQTDIKAFDIDRNTKIVYEGVFEKCPSDLCIYYHGTETEWSEVIVGNNNPSITINIHNWDEGVITTEPTHTAEGIKVFTCTCGEAYTEAVEKLPEHVWGEGVVTTEPTAEAEGVKTYTCECGETKTEAIPRLPANDFHQPENEIVPLSNNDNGAAPLKTSGCGAVMSGGTAMIALISLGGALIVSKKKKK